MENLSDSFKSKPLVLVVDDEPGIREIVSMTLDRMGATTLEASSAEEALEVLQREPISVVLCDIKMKGQSGLDLLSRCHVQGVTVPFVFLTGYDSSDYLMRAVRLGAMDFVLKPIKAEELNLVLSRVLAITVRSRRIDEIIASVSHHLSPELQKELLDLGRQIAMTRTMLAKKRNEGSW
ncbi:MAG: response regulator [Proteobacteria bacterium]|nr:MAG: response regulator [Pseudomonadota bacterium]